MESNCVYSLCESYNISDVRTHTDYNIIYPKKKKKLTQNILTMVDLHFDKLNLFHKVGLNS